MASRTEASSRDRRRRLQCDGSRERAGSEEGASIGARAALQRKRTRSDSMCPSASRNGIRTITMVSLRGVQASTPAADTHHYARSQPEAAWRMHRAAPHASKRPSSLPRGVPNVPTQPPVRATHGQTVDSKRMRTRCPQWNDSNHRKNGRQTRRRLWRRRGTACM